MCEFCTQHGEGKKWYLEMKNYSRELLNAGWRKKIFKKYTDMDRLAEMVSTGLAKVEKVNKLPSVIRNFLKRIAVKHQKKVHYGQVIPIEDVRKIISMVDSVVRLPCVCRKVTIGEEKRYCFGIGMDPQNLLGEYPAKNLDLERLDKPKALAALEELDKKGLFHSVWTFGTPFIAGICNCDRDCGAYRTRVWNNFNTFFKGEYVAGIDREKCNGCKTCQKQCQFGAISFSLGQQKCYVEQKICYGCGICQTACPKKAVTLTERVRIPALAREW